MKIKLGDQTEVTLSDLKRLENFSTSHSILRSNHSAFRKRATKPSLTQQSETLKNPLPFFIRHRNFELLAIMNLQTTKGLQIFSDDLWNLSQIKLKPGTFENVVFIFTSLRNNWNSWLGNKTKESKKVKYSHALHSLLAPDHLLK